MKSKTLYYLVIAQRLVRKSLANSEEQYKEELYLSIFTTALY